MPATGVRKSGKGWPGALVCWFCLFVFYSWLISKVQLQQIIAAALVGLVVAIGMTALSRSAGLGLKIRLRWLGLLAWRLPAKVLHDLRLLAAAFGRALAGRKAAGRFKQIPFDLGGEGPASAARRALVTVGVSVPPNTIAVGTDANKRVLMAHQLVFETEVPQDKEWPL